MWCAGLMSCIRTVPTPPAAGSKIRLLIDTDAANEIDDLYAVGLAIQSSDRIAIEGFVATHFAGKPGPDSTEQSYQLLLEVLKVAGCENDYVVKRGGHPMQYPRTPTESEGTDFIIERARAGSTDNPLWVVGLGAATNLASAILKAPDLAPRVRFLFRARNEFNWPTHTTQFNVVGDIIAVQTLLECDAPLAWFDTGTALTITMEETEKRLAPLSPLGTFLHEYRHKHPHHASPNKGFFDLGDIAWLMQPDLCKMEVTPAPQLARHCVFDQTRTFGDMLRIYEIDRDKTWELFFSKFEQTSSNVQ